VPDRKPDGSFIASSLSSKTENSNSSPALSELSKRDRIWDTHRYESDRVANHYEGIDEFQKYADRIKACSELLNFRLVPDNSDGTYKLKLAAAHFCHCRHCIVCTWRKSLRQKARAYQILPKLLDDYPTARFLFVTLTVKNCKITELRDTILWMNKGFARLSQLKDWPALGYIKTAEVTRGRDGYSAHPHFHVLLMVKASYFGVNYINQREWVAMWRKSARLDYNPVLDVQALKSKSSLVALLAEVIKYQCKPSTLVYSEREWFLELTRQLHRTKAIAIGGVFREYFRELEREPEDLIGDDGEGEVDEGRLLFNWRRIEKRYRMIDQ
jgi:plasmid rolling circle replication initiator protein Rep